jgi:serine/threonine protein kinase
VNAEGEAIISDFGLSRFIREVSPSITVKGAVRWMAPEVIFPSIFGTSDISTHKLARDTWAFGMTALVSMQLLIG